MFQIWLNNSASIIFYFFCIYAIFDTSWHPCIWMKSRMKKFLVKRTSVLYKSYLHGCIPLLCETFEVFTGLNPNRHCLIDFFDCIIMLSFNLCFLGHKKILIVKTKNLKLIKKIAGLNFQVQNRVVQKLLIIIQILPQLKIKD